MFTVLKRHTTATDQVTTLGYQHVLIVGTMTADVQLMLHSRPPRPHCNTSTQLTIYNVLDGYPASLGFPIMHRVKAI